MALPTENKENDTICAIATAMSEAGIGIIRISGPRAIEIGDRLFRNARGEATLHSAAANTIRFGRIVNPDRPQEAVDEVMVSVLRAPHSYTTEDTVEINSHGGIYVMNRVLSCVLRCGARLAEPGEFTKRAYLGGRIDLSEAEAVMDLISSQNEFARKNSLSQLSGALSRQIRAMREAVLYELAFIESALDDPENFDTDGYPARLRGKLCGLLIEIDRLLAHADEGQVLKDGIRTVIVGRPNAGKSSLLNYLAGQERAIVTEIPGTTRDTLEETVRMDGVLLRLVDTAGIRETDDAVEKIGVERARRAAAEADLLLYLIDGSAPLTAEDREIAALVESALREGKKAIVLCNKSDLGEAVTEDEVRALFRAGEECARQECSAKPFILTVSLKTQTGLDLLRAAIESLFHAGELLQNAEVYLTNARHKEALQRARESLTLVTESIDKGLGEDFYSIDLMNAYAALGEILGEQVDDDLVEEIFSKFCLGK